MFGKLKKAFAAGAAASKTELSAAYAQNRDFLEAVAAAAALIAGADGEVEDVEKQKAVQILGQHKLLATLYKREEIEKIIDQSFTTVKSSTGRQALARELDDVKKRGDATFSEDVYLIASDVAGADGEVDPKEAETLKKIAQRLGVDPARFEF